MVRPFPVAPNDPIAVVFSAVGPQRSQPNPTSPMLERYSYGTDLFVDGLNGMVYAITLAVPNRNWRGLRVGMSQTNAEGMLAMLGPPREAEPPTDARVLFEESGDETGFVYDGMYLSSFVPHLTGRQLIGGPINLYNDRHHFAEFHSGRMFQKDLKTLSDDEIKNYFRLYNIGAVVAFHPASIERLLSVPGLISVERRIGPVQLMKVNQPLSWFMQGDGKIKAGFNRLELSGLAGREVILKYHWIDGLIASPAARIEPVKMADDPIPFIKIINPPAALILRAGS